MNWYSDDSSEHHVESYRLRSEDLDEDQLEEKKNGFWAEGCRRWTLSAYSLLIKRFTFSSQPLAVVNI